MVARYCSRIVVMQQGESSSRARPRTCWPAAASLHPQAARGDAARLPARAPAEAQTPIVAVRDLVVDYPGQAGLFPQGGGQARAARHQPGGAPREVVAVVGGSGSGKTTLGQRDRRPGQADRRRHPVQRQADLPERRGWLGLPAELPDGLPGPVFLARPAHDHRPARRRAAAAGPGHGRGRQEGARRRGADRGRPRRRLRRALSARALGRPAPARGDCPRRWCAGRASSSPTSRSRRSTSPCARRCWSCSPNCSASTASPACSSAMISAWSSRSPTA
jgi:hypothetical protein